ncbi:MAG: KH domain-containing protein, partial [Alphaproteobacteria bacterium]
PYKITVETEDWEQRTDGSAHVRQVIYVERDSQKGIVLGRQGAMVKQIGAAARTELQDLLGHPVHLFIHVKVRGKWQDDRERYAEWGLDFDA